MRLERWRVSGTDRPAAPLIVLARRGTRHGRLRCAERRATTAAERAAAWRGDRPILLPGVLSGALPRARVALSRSLRLFEELRRGRRTLQDEVRARLAGRSEFSPTGATVDLGDAREIEKVFVDGMRGKRFAARGLYAKLSWIAHDERDLSLRIRFSFGSENERDWQKETRRAPWADRYAEALFPECAAQAGNARLVRTVEELAGRRVRFSERILYNNAPDGGAVFHHDCEPHQLGVVFGQLAGETAWLALPKRALARHVAEHARAAGLRGLPRTPRAALRALDSDDARLAHLLNATPAFSVRLAESGALFHLLAGDALLLPNHGWDDTCWHSVFALGRRASLAHSYGIFAKRRRTARTARGGSRGG
jgi:hypothetical protein